ncbi:MAG: putative CRISPR-associated protein [Stenomitos frigidus ULC029]
MMPNVIVSTVGTSLLTNQIAPKNEEERGWNQQLRDYANCEGETPERVKAIIHTLKERARESLAKADIAKIRRSSAELNGIYGLYNGDLAQGKQDLHFLIATDTLQGQTTAKVVEEFLRSHGLTAISYTPAGLSTATTQTFAEGIDDLIVWLQNTVKPLWDTYKVYFNMVGGFKSLQGYMNTIGMFYADAILYIFEGQNSELITIPRLPIKVDAQLLAPHAAALALMDAGAGLSPDAVDGIPEAMLGDYQGKKVLSTWGILTWNEAKAELLAKDLLQFPKLLYTHTFRADYNQVKIPKQRVELQQDLAKVSQTLQDANGDTRALRSVAYSPYQDSNGIDHFRVNLSLRISCRKVENGLELRYYGTHDHVERKEGL